MSRLIDYLFHHPKEPRSKLGRRELLTVAGAGAIATIVPIRAAHAQDEIAPFLGTFNFSGGDKERAGLTKAIDDLVSEMNFIARGIARDKLKKANPIPSMIGFASDPKILTVTFDSRTYTAPLDGSPVKVKGILGDDMALAYKIGPSRIDQLFIGDEKGRTNTLHLDGTTCTMNVRIYASKLPRDLLYTLTFTKC